MVTSAALVPSMLETKIEFILNTVFAVAVTKSVSVVVKANTSVFPFIVATLTIFGFAILSSYPKTIAIAIALPVDIPAVEKDNCPLASVIKAWPLEPSEDGSLK